MFIKKRFDLSSPWLSGVSFTSPCGPRLPAKLSLIGACTLRGAEAVRLGPGHGWGGLRAKEHGATVAESHLILAPG